MQWHELTKSAVGLPTSIWLKEWRWLVPQGLSPLWLSAFGDWAFCSSDGKIHFLDLLEGTLNCISGSAQELDSLLREPGNQNQWLLADWVHICKQRGLFLKRDQCYGWKAAPVIGGKFEFENIQVFDLAVYQSIMGQVHRQLEGLAPGFVITEFKMGTS